MNKQEVLLEITSARIKKNKILITSETPFEINQFEFIDFSFIQLDNQFFIFNDYKSVVLYDYEITTIQAKSPDSKDLEQHVKSIPENNLKQNTSELDAFVGKLKDNKPNKEQKDDIF